jgi:hypothetical protein
MSGNIVILVNMKMEEYKTGTGQTVLVHPECDCQGEHCVIHNPSDHSMRDFPTHWRGDIGLMERICPHGVGHPDPDDLAFKYRMAEKFNRPKPDHFAVHGCDGCCIAPQHTGSDIPENNMKGEKTL